LRLLAAWTTNRFGLSLACGGFLTGMMLGETGFRHQIEATVRPFRDVLLGMFFVGFGMRVDPAGILPIWHWALTGALLIVIALDVQVLDPRLGQIAMSSVLPSLILGAVLFKFNARLARRLAPGAGTEASSAVEELPVTTNPQVLIAGYGHVAHAIAVLLHASDVPFDTDTGRVAQGMADGHAVSYGDLSDPAFLAALQPARASLVVTTVNDTDAALRIVDYLRAACPGRGHQFDHSGCSRFEL
jgi:CPA2 family monovalent cation:H+ antiporter-2